MADLPAPRGPLAGLRVVEFAGLGPAPFAAMMLADLGADVLRISRPGAAGPPRTNILNRARRSLAIDLKDPEGRETVLALVEHADVLLEGFRPGVTERLGLGPDDCLARNPALVYGRVTGWGQDGPLAGTAGHDINYIARTGALHAIGRADGPPQVPLNVVGDFGGGGMLLAFGVCAALWERQESGRGQVVDAAIVDGVACQLAMQYGFLADNRWRDERGVNILDSGAPYYDVYETGDGRWVSVGAVEEQFYTRLVEGLSLTSLPSRDDPENWPVIRAAFAERFRERTRAEWTAHFAGTDACVAPVLSLSEAPGDEQLAARRTYEMRNGVVQPSPAPRFSRTPAPPTADPTSTKGDAPAVLRDWGIQDVDGLIDRGVVTT